MTAAPFKKNSFLESDSTPLNTNFNGISINHQEFIIPTTEKKSEAIIQTIEELAASSY